MILKELVNEKYKNNIIDNIEIIRSNLFKSINGEIYLFKYLVNAKSKYPPSLIELLLSVTGNDEESKIFIENNFYNSNPMIENQEQHKSIFLIK